MNRRSVLTSLSVLLGACVCVLCAALLAGGGYVAFRPLDRAAEGDLANLELPLKPEVLATAGAESVDRAEQALIDWMRNTSGVRTSLGTQADEVFHQVDEARALAVQQMVDQYLAQAQPKAQAKPAPLLFPLPPAREEPRQVAQTQSARFVLTFVSIAPVLFGNDFFAKFGSVLFPPAEDDTTPEEGVHMHRRAQPKLTGSRLEMEVETTIRAEKDGNTYEEKVVATSLFNLCPDAQGEVPVELTLRGSVAAEGSGGQWQFRSQAIGHVDDEANLSGYDVQTQADVASQPGSGEIAKGERNRYAEWNHRFTVKGFHEKDKSVVGYPIVLTRQSSKVDRKFVQDSFDKIWEMNSQAMDFAFGTAEKSWQKEFCIEIAVPEMGSVPEKEVQDGSRTPFTAVVRHKFEKKELAVPVIATLASGAVSVSPTGSKEPAPATFHYKAPDTGAGKAEVQLESRSRRGVGKLTVSFLTSQNYVLLIDSKIRFVGLGGVLISDSHVEATVPLRYGSRWKDWTGRGPFRYVSFDVLFGGGSQCSLTGKPSDGGTIGATVDIDMDPPLTSGSRVKLNFNGLTDDVKEDLRVTCQGMRSTISVRSQLWASSFEKVHAEMGDWIVEDWTLSTNPDGSIVATKTFKRAGVKVPDGVVDEDTTLVIKKLTK